MIRSALVGSSLALLLLLPSGAQAQLSQYYLPVESGVLESHVDLQYQYSKQTNALGGGDVNVSLLSIEGQMVLGERWELGINVPFVAHGGLSSGNETSFGDIMLDIKAKLFGIGKNIGVAAYLNTYLPTHSGDFTRKYAVLQGGVVAAAQLIGFSVGGGVQTVWTILGDDQPDSGLLGVYAYGRVPILGLIAVQLAVEYFNSLHPGGGDVNALLITPSLEASISVLHVGLGARIATTDEAKLVALGRVAVVANAGLRF